MSNLVIKNNYCTITGRDGANSVSVVVDYSRLIEEYNLVNAKDRIIELKLYHKVKMAIPPFDIFDSVSRKKIGTYSFNGQGELIIPLDAIYKAFNRVTLLLNVTILAPYFEILVSYTNNEVVDEKTNKGLKPHTKQITGYVGSIGYNVNVNYNESNVILTIPLLQSNGVNKIGLSLIYNHQNRTATSIYGKGINDNYKYKLEENTDKYNITNPDGSIDVYDYDSVIQDGTYPTYIYHSKTNNNLSLCKKINSSGAQYYLKDKSGNIYSWDYSFNYISRIELKNEFVINYKPETGVMVNNGLTSKISYTLNSTGNINQMFCYENNLEQERVTFNINNSTKNLASIIYSQLGIVNESYSFEFNNNYIRVYDTKKEYAVLFTISSNIVTRITEEFYGDVEQDDGTYETEMIESNVIYNITANLTESVITDKFGNTNTIVYKDNLKVLEYDNKGNVIITEYNDNNLITYQSNIINPSKLAEYVLTATLYKGNNNIIIQNRLGSKLI